MIDGAFTINLGKLFPSLTNLIVKFPHCTTVFSTIVLGSSLCDFKKNQDQAIKARSQPPMQGQTVTPKVSLVEINGHCCVPIQTKVTV